MRYDVFVSYSHAESEWVHEWLVPRLQESSLSVIYDKWFAPGGTITGAITEAMQESRITLLVFTPSFLSKDWTNYEQKAALYANIVGNSRAIPLLLTDCPLPAAFAFITAADFRDASEQAREEALKKLVAAIRSDTRLELIPPQPPRPAIYRNFDIELDPADADRYHMRAGCAQIDAVTTQIVTIATAGMHADLDRVRRGSADRYLCESVGRRLYEAVFTPEVRELWNHTIETSRVGDGRSAVRLRIRPLDRRLAALPWELLCADEFELGLGHEYPIIRNSGEVRMPPRGDSEKRPNVLLLDAAPGSAHAAAIEKHLRELEAGGRIGALRHEVAGTDDELQTKLRSGPFAIVHVVGRAGMHNGSECLLVGEQQIDAAVFPFLLRSTQARLLVLTTPAAASPAGDDPLTGIAASVNRIGVPAVVAVPAAVSQPAATAFAKAFYSVLTDGCPVEACVAEGRKAIMRTATLNNPQWGLPLLFNDDPDALMFGAEPPRYCFGGPSQAREQTHRRELRDASGGGRTRHNVPGEKPAQVVGRDEVIRDVWTALRTGGANNLVVLRSSAGFGKTAVARWIAWQALHEVQPNGPAPKYESVIWTSSSDSRGDDAGDIPRDGSQQITADTLARAVAGVFDQRQLLKIEPTARLRELAMLFAHGTHLMLIDDVSTAAQDDVRRFIEAMPRTVHFVVTSARRLNAGEFDIEIGPLADADARALAARIAGESELVLPADTPTFGGNPFIIETEVRRAATLRAAVDGGVASSSLSDYIRALIPLLPPEQQRVLAVCVRLPMPAAEPVVAQTSRLDAQAFESARDALLRIGLIERAGPRLALCSTLRTLFREGEEAAQKLLPDVSLACVDALMAFMDETRRNAHAQDSPEFVMVVQPELGNVLWGAQTAYAIGLFDRLRGFREMLEHTLYRIGAWKAALELGELCFLAASRTGDFAEMGWSALYPLARIHYHSGNLRDTERWCATAIGLFTAVNRTSGILHAKRYLARVRQTEGRFDEARALFREIHDEVWRIHGSSYDIACAIDSLASLEQAAGNLEQAETLFQQALAYYGAEAAPDAITPALHELGRLAIKRNDYDAALTYFDRARQLLGRSPWRNRYARIRHSIGLVYERKGDLAAATEHFLAAQEVFSSLGAKLELAATDAALVRIGAMRERQAP